MSNVNLSFGAKALPRKDGKVDVKWHYTMTPVDGSDDGRAEHGGTIFARTPEKAAKLAAIFDAHVNERKAHPSAKGHVALVHADGVSTASNVVMSDARAIEKHVIDGISRLGHAVSDELHAL
jgi:hypothetical protein